MFSGLFEEFVEEEESVFTSLLILACVRLLCFVFLFLQVFEGLKPSDKFEKTLDYRCTFFARARGSFYLSREFDCYSRSISSKCTTSPSGFPDGLLAMTSGGNVSLSQRASLTREVAFGTAWQTCLRSFAPARPNVTCPCLSSAARPTR